MNLENWRMDRTGVTLHHIDSTGKKASCGKKLRRSNRLQPGEEHKLCKVCLYKVHYITKEVYYYVA